MSGTNVITRSADDGSLISSQSGFTGTSGIVRFDARTGALYTPTSGSGIEQWLPGRSSDDSALLGDVVTSLCERVGLTAADLDVTELTDEVHGFGIARQISVRGALEMLAAAYSFDAVESDHQLKFKKRGRSPSRVIAEQDLVPVNAEREAFIETRAQEVDLPLRFTVVYQDLERDADIGTQYAKRVAGPSSAMHSQNDATFDLPLMLTAAEAKGIALRQLHSAWLERTGYEWRLPWTHVDLEPADVVQVALDDGTLLNVRILETELGANLELAWKTVLEESSSYTVTAVPGGGLNYLPQVDPVSSEARLFLLDVPLIRDSDDALRAATGHYWAAAAYFDPPWRGAVLFSSDDGAVYVAADETLDAVAWGVARTALPDTDLPFQTDLTSQLHLTMVSGSLASVSNLEMLNGANLAALIRADGNAELIQFQDIALSEGVYTLTTLLRGRRGTEVFTGGHAVGDLFVLLGGDGVTRRPLGLDRLGDTLHYRAVGRGGELRDARTAQLTLAGNDLKPYAPAQLEATGSWGSNVTLSWQRRTRVGGELIDGSGRGAAGRGHRRIRARDPGRPGRRCAAHRDRDHDHQLHLYLGHAVGRFRRRADRAELRRLPDQRAGRAWFPGRAHRGDPAVRLPVSSSLCLRGWQGPEDAIKDASRRRRRSPAAILDSVLRPLPIGAEIRTGERWPGKAGVASGGVRLRAPVSARVVGDAVGPGAPEDARPGAGQDADRVGVIAAAGAGAPVDVGGPGALAAGVVGHAGERSTQALVAGPAPADASGLAALIGDGNDAGLGGELVLGREARAHVAELGQDLGGAHPAGPGERT